jgi:hypothetical protein
MVGKLSCTVENKNMIVVDLRAEYPEFLLTHK